MAIVKFRNFHTVECGIQVFCLAYMNEIFVLGNTGKSLSWVNQGKGLRIVHDGAIIEKLKIYFSFLKVFKHKHSVCEYNLSMLVQGNFNFTKFFSHSNVKSLNCNFPHFL